MFNREPTLILGVIRAAIVLGVCFGLNLSTEQVGAIYVFVEAVLSLVNRSQVSPVADD